MYNSVQDGENQCQNDLVNDLVNDSNNLIELDPVSGAYNCRSWKTLNGYDRQARKIARCLVINSKTKPYLQHVVVSIDDHMTVELHKKLWASLCRQLKSLGVIAFWSREINLRGRVHYHLITTTFFKPELYSQLASEKIRVHVQTITSSYHLCHYVLKAKYGQRRIYFSKSNKLSKIGTIGKFWDKPIAKLWSDVIDYEKSLTPFMEVVYAEAKFIIHPMVDTEYSLRKVMRTMAHFKLQESLLNKATPYM